jgi:hypothetical protein
LAFLKHVIGYVKVYIILILKIKCNIGVI